MAGSYRRANMYRIWETEVSVSPGGEYRTMGSGEMRNGKRRGKKRDFMGEIGKEA